MGEQVGTGDQDSSGFPKDLRGLPEGGSSLTLGPKPGWAGLKMVAAGSLSCPCQVHGPLMSGSGARNSAAGTRAL